jgi:hypothetical protein
LFCAEVYADRRQPRKNAGSVVDFNGCSEMPAQRGLEIAAACGMLLERFLFVFVL